MDPVSSVRTCFAKYADFNGRASRPEFWWFALFTGLILLAARIVQAMLSAMEFAAAGTRLAMMVTLVSVVLNVGVFALTIALGIPLLAAGSRRLHDRNQSGWLQLLLLVPCAFIALIVLWALEGTPGPNNFGPPPGWTVPPAVTQ